MILLLLRDGDFAEVPSGTDVIHRNQILLCIDAMGETVASFNAAEIVAYTCSEAAARRLTGDDDEQESMAGSRSNSDKEPARPA